MKDLLLGLLTKMFNKTEKEAADILFEKSEDGEESLKEGSLNEVLNLYEVKLKKLREDSKGDKTKSFEDGYKKAEKEIMVKLEGDLKEKYGLESEKLGVELIDEVVEKFKKGSKLEPDQIKMTDTYREMEKRLKKENKDKELESQTKIAELQKGFEKDKTWSVISKDIRKLLMESGPVLPSNQRASENLVNLYVDSFKDYEWQVDEAGDHFPVKDGKRVEDNLGNPVVFKNLVTGRVPEYFDIKKQGGKGSAGNDNNSGAGQDGVPSSFADEKTYVDYVTKEPDVKKRIAAKEIYDKTLRGK
jgi:hypothetical protein